MINSYAPDGKTPADFKGLINVQPDGSVEGVDVPFPVGTFSYTFRTSNATVTQAYQDGIENLLETPINASSFFGRPAGEVRFMGASGRQVFGRNYDFSITFRFKRRKNKTGIAIGDMTGITKDGWDYLWQHPGRKDNPATKQFEMVPKSVYVNRVMQRGDFSVLGPWVAA